MEQNYLIFCDGACSGNPGPGGWGAIIETPTQKVIELGGASPASTNNRMEMTAAIEAISWVSKFQKKPSSIKIYTDSQYLIHGMTKWMEGWKKRNWKNTEGKPVANQDLWNLLLELTEGLKIEWFYVRGHQGIPENERADQIAVHFSKGKNIQLFEGSKENYLHFSPS